ncbi:17beta-estradiol 17-dehydrogenase / very-long-chain 3-oxoacyl-CoA reductase [Nematocida sp. AWRm80]|nr:17beta-estradiol 17-dehydrogenase / very-long-chain 3-oxoacyl-CoA reductase [Nematocida sp. AWRm80]
MEIILKRVSYGLCILVKWWILAVLFDLCWAAARSLVILCIRNIYNARLRKTLKNRWVIVTGSTDGIGLGIARELANQGINLILISRTQEKLQAVKTELEKKVKVEIIPIDFSKEVDFSKVLSKIKKKDIPMLINNVGTNTTRPVAFTEHTQEEEDAIIKVNIQNTLRITREFISWDPMPKEKKYIITVGSMLGYLASPYQQIYSGTKAFLQHWVEGTNIETPGYHFELLMTGLVCSKLSGTKRPNFFTPTSNYYGKRCVKAIGFTTITYPYIPHAILGYLSYTIPRFSLMLVFYWVGKAVRRRRHLRDLAKAQQQKNL